VMGHTELRNDGALGSSSPKHSHPACKLEHLDFV
jgi:hypothetical protein